MESVFDLGTPLLRCLPPEQAHRATIALLRTSAPFLSPARDDDPRLGMKLLGLSFPNPIGVAAGFDKDGEVPDAILKLGFGFAECGTLTPKPQSGNPKPRLFRLAEDKAVINRLGFNSAGVERAHARLMQRRKRGVVGINLGANKDSPDRIADYLEGMRKLAPLASYIAVNISSPNTPGLRGLQDRADLERLLNALMRVRTQAGLTTPLLLKIAPDLDETALDDIADVCLNAGLDGIIVSNTTVARPDFLKSKYKNETGGLSGAPLFAPSTAVLKKMRARVGEKLVLVGVGGVASGQDAYAKIRAGASLVQLYTALVFQGPGLVRRIKRELLMLLERDGYTNVAAAIGADVR